MPIGQVQTRGMVEISELGRLLSADMCMLQPKTTLKTHFQLTFQMGHPSFLGVSCVCVTGDEKPSIYLNSSVVTLIIREKDIFVINGRQGSQ